LGKTDAEALVSDGPPTPKAKKKLKMSACLRFGKGNTLGLYPKPSGRINFRIMVSQKAFAEKKQVLLTSDLKILSGP
jgi:hypothetical protein